MSFANRILLLVCFLIANAAFVHAQVFGPYPGLKGLVEKSDTIVIVQVDSAAVKIDGQWKNRKQLSKDWQEGRIQYDPRWGSSSSVYQPYFIKPLHVIKGSTATLTNGMASISTFRSSDADPASDSDKKRSSVDSYILWHSRVVGDYAVLFLKGTDNEGLVETLNCPGSAVTISEETAKNPPAGKNPVDTLKEIIKESKEELRKRKL